MEEFLTGVLVVVLLIALAIAILFIICVCIVIGLAIGVFIALFTAVKSYYGAINKEISNPFIKWTLNIGLGICSVCIAVPLAITVIGIIVSIF